MPATRGWAVVAPSGAVMLLSVADCRDAAIQFWDELNMGEQRWPYWEKHGYRAARIEITAEPEPRHDP